MILVRLHLAISFVKHEITLPNILTDERTIFVCWLKRSCGNSAPDMTAIDILMLVLSDGKVERKQAERAFKDFLLKSHVFASGSAGGLQTKPTLARVSKQLKFCRLPNQIR